MLPDEPRWVEANGILASGRGWRQRLGDRAVAIGHDGARLIVIAPDPGVDVDELPAAVPVHALAHLASSSPQHALLFPLPLAPVIARAQRRPARAILHTLADPDAVPDAIGAASLPADASLAHVPAPLAAELAAARAEGRAIHAVYLDGEPVAFAHAPWRTARWFDVSVDTLPTARQLGLGTLAAAALIHAERANGREPVWGADEDHHASRALARRLGFTAIGELGVAAPVR